MTKRFIVVLIISILALGFSAFSFVNSIRNEENQGKEVVIETQNDTSDEQETEDVQYVLYLGTNDKDTNEPVYSEEECKEKLKEILINRFGGYTIQEANGGWKDDDKIYEEYTLVIYLSDTNIEDVHAACDEMIEVFHQSSVLIQANKTSTEFYSAE